MLRILCSALFLAAAPLAVVPLTVTPAQAKIEIDVTRGNVAPVPIAIPNFLGNALGEKIAKVVEADLERSGLFKPVPREAHIQKIKDGAVQPDFGDWQAIDAQALLVGQTVPGSGGLQTQVRLYDVYGNAQLLGKQFATNETNWRRVAHIIADAIYEEITGEKGYFDTRVVFVDETGPKSKRSKRLAIMDQDGANVRYLTRGGELVLTPRFSPSRQEITYMSFGDGEPRVYLLQLETGQRQLLGNFPNMTFSPRFSPDGRKVVLSLSDDGVSNIHVMDLASGQVTKLTDSSAIDTSPSYAPDGNRIVFESDRGGRQQLYVMEANGSNVRRISFGTGAYSTPVWSPRGDLIAFTKQSGGQFLIGVMRPDGSGERILTEGYHNEGPTWAPNGRTLMFFRDTPGAKGGPKLFSIDLTGYNERPGRHARLRLGPGLVAAAQLMPIGHSASRCGGRDS